MDIYDRELPFYVDAIFSFPLLGTRVISRNLDFRFCRGQETLSTGTNHAGFAIYDVPPFFFRATFQK